MPRPWRAELLAAAGATLLALAGAFVVLHLWNADLGTPFDYSGDANLTHAVIKGVIDHGWYEENPSLGAPNGQELYDFPVWNGDNLQFAIVKALGLAVSNAALVMNLFFLLTFPLAALTAFLVFRRLGLSNAVAVVCSTLFALLPYHFLRGEDHLFLASYYAVPVGAWLALAIYRGEALFEGVRSRRTLLTVGVCVVVASAAVYYAAFTLLFVAAAALLAALARRSRTPLVAGGLVVAVVAAALVVNFAPSLAHRVQEGANPRLERHAFETETFSLRLAQLLLPVRDHRLEPLADVKRRYEEKVGVTEASFASLGVVGAVGFVWLLGVLAAAVVGRAPADPLHRYASASTLVAVLFATTGGFAAALAFLVSPQLHAWNRLSVFIAFFSLLAVGLLLDMLGRRLPRAGFAAVLAAVLVLGMLDQTTGAMVPRYGEVEAAYESDEAFVEAVEAQLPAGASVYQLPYVPFPAEPPAARTVDYDHLRPYLHSEELRWSYGAMKGREEDVGDDLAALPLDQAVERMRSLGFAGVEVDRFGYDDAGGAVEAELRSLTGAEPLVSRDGRLAFYAL